MSPGFLYLRVSVQPGAVCVFNYSRDGKTFRRLGDPFTARQGRWVGAKVGIFAQASSRIGNAGYADFDWFRFSKNSLVR